MEIREGLTFDDVLLTPNYSELKSRSEVDLSVEFPKEFKFSHPIVPANMKTVIGYDMAEEIFKAKGLGIIHRFMSLEDQIDIFDRLNNKNIKKEDVANYIGFSVGVKESDTEVVDKLIYYGAKILCIDVAHGDSKMCIEMCQYISNEYPEVLLIAGNVATGSAARRLWEAGADIVKVGIGPGSLCSTRVETGNGVPQLTALMDVYEERQKLQATGIKFWQKSLPIIADGGIKNAGDCVKALCFADMVMAGSLFAGCDESPGFSFVKDGKFYKEYAGSSTHKTNHIEGVVALVQCKGSFTEIMRKLLEGIRSGCSYQGSSNLTELKESPQFVRISNSGLKESLPHVNGILK